MKVEIALTIACQTPVSVGAGGSAGTIADKTILRDGWGRPTLPGSQVKGKLRWAAEQLLRGYGLDIPAPGEGRLREEQDSPVRVLFGSPEHRSPLRFADLPGVVGELDQIASLRDSPEQKESQIRPSVVINRQRGTAADQLLIFQEVAPELLRFHGARAISGSVPDPGHAALLWAAARLTTRWGGAKSRGLGWAALDASVQLDGRAYGEDELRQALRDLLTRPGGA